MAFERGNNLTMHAILDHAIVADPTIDSSAMAAARGMQPKTFMGRASCSFVFCRSILLIVMRGVEVATSGDSSP